MGISRSYSIGHMRQKERDYVSVAHADQLSTGMEATLNMVSGTVYFLEFICLKGCS